MIKLAFLFLLFWGMPWADSLTIAKNDSSINVDSILVANDNASTRAKLMDSLASAHYDAMMKSLDSIKQSTIDEYAIEAAHGVVTGFDLGMTTWAWWVIKDHNTAIIPVTAIFFSLRTIRDFYKWWL